jgi:hypothetical protein
VLLLFAWHARPVGSTDNPLAKLWAKADRALPLRSLLRHPAQALGLPRPPGAWPAPLRALHLGASGSRGAAGTGAGADPQG